MRRRLQLLVVTIIAPGIVLVGLLTLQAYRNERELVARELTHTSRALAATVDRQISQYEALLRGLATSSTLDRYDFRGFDQRARMVAEGEYHWIVLSDASGQQLVNTHLPWDARELPRSPIDPQMAKVISSGRTHLSNVSNSPVANVPVFAVSLPVVRNGRADYILSLVTTPLAFTRHLDFAYIASGSVVAVIDRSGMIAARNQSPERFAGGKAGPKIVEATAANLEGTMPGVTLEGTPVLTAVSRSTNWGWSVAIGAPNELLYASAQRLLWLGLAIAGVLLLIPTLLAKGLGRAVIRGVDRLVADTEAIGRGVLPAETSSGLAETDFVARAMRRTAEQLTERRRENVALNLALQNELAKQKQAYAETRRLAAIVESSDDAIIATDLSGRIVSWNQAAEQILGYPVDEILGQPIERLLPPERVKQEPSLLDRLREGRPSTSFETVRLRKNQTRVEVSVTVSPILDRDGTILGASKIVRDITARRRNEEQQQAVHELVAIVNRAGALREIYEAALDAIGRCQHAERASILLRDQAGVMRFVAWKGLSEQYRRLVEGHSPWAADDPRPRTVWIEDVSRAELDSKLREALEREGIQALAFVPLTYEQKLLGKFMVYYDRPHFFVRDELRAAETISSQVAFAIHRQRSADALEALVNERTASLREAIAQMEEFSYSVSHDLRSPVRAMSGYAAALLQDYADQLDPMARDMLARIERSSMRMDRLIQDLLTYSRVSQREISVEPVPMEKLVRELIHQYPDMHPQRADIDITGPLPEVIAHEPSLTQVVSNLLSNAVKFVPAGTRPRVRISGESIDSRARLWFEDNGIGIKPEYHARVFGMFERVHAEKTYEGTGMGLAIVRKAMERMNGRVGLESNGVTGCRFWIELPRHRR